MLAPDSRLDHHDRSFNFAFCYYVCLNTVFRKGLLSLVFTGKSRSILPKPLIVETKLVETSAWYSEGTVPVHILSPANHSLLGQTVTSRRGF